MPLPPISITSPTLQNPVSGITGQSFTLTDGPIIYAAGNVDANQSALPTPALSSLANGVSGALVNELPLVLGAAALFLLVMYHR